MIWPKNKKNIAVHSGNFHPDDVFSVACLSVLYKGNIKIIRTREHKVYSKADFIIDVGLEYSPAENKFDHHQTGGAGIRPNGISYSSFGLLWKKYGEEICGSKEIADIIDTKLVTIIDADDDGFNLCQPVLNKVYPLTMTDIIYTMQPTWKETFVKVDNAFLGAVDFAKGIIERQIKLAKDKLEINKIIQNYYKNTLDKRLIVVDSPKVSRHDVWDALQDFPEPLFIVYGSNDDWSVVAMKKEINSFANRKNFPVEWKGLRDDKLVEVTGVSDAIFCLNDLFLVGTKSKEGAIKLAKLALQNN